MRKAFFTEEERELFLRGAEKRNMTLTDFLVSAALYKPSPAIRECKTILKKLNEVQAKLLSDKSEHPDYADVLSAQKDLYQMLFLLAYHQEEYILDVNYVVFGLHSSVAVGYRKDGKTHDLQLLLEYGDEEDSAVF